MIVYIHPRCSTCKKSLSFLTENKINFTTKDITITPPSIEELTRMFLLQGDIKKLFNTSGLLYKSLELKEKLSDMSNEEALELLSNHGMLIKRPFILTDKMGCTGFNPKVWNQYFLI